MSETETEKYFEKMGNERLKSVAETANKDAYMINGKTYHRRKITVKEFNQLEKIRAAFAKEQDPEKAVDILASLYLESARIYLGMTEEEFYNAPWEESKLVVDACSHRTLYGAPFL